MHLDEVFDLKDDDSQQQLTSWTRSEGAFYTEEVFWKAAQHAVVAGEALRLTSGVGWSLSEQNQERGM